ncbi:MAG: peptide chain release factor-like protein [Candidatus Gracilibacteria bacterium]|nr:peptide chain release factor-like protein [Candidatus Gracilibacteria bacterium]
MISREQIEPTTTKLFSRSSGAGGQNVNKVNTKVQLHFEIAPSGLSEIQKRRLFRKYPDGIIRIECQETRSQARNVHRAFELLEERIERALVVKKARQKKRAPHLTKGGKLRKMMKDKLKKFRNRKLNI